MEKVDWDRLPDELADGSVVIEPGCSRCRTRTTELGEVKTHGHSPDIDEALAIFLRQNQDLLIARYGIETAKAEKITAGLFPNTELSVTGFSAFTQKCTFSDCRAIMPRSVNCLSGRQTRVSR